MPNENKPSYAGFLEFIENQPKERQIDHTRVWCNCAVGDYLTDIGAEDDQAAAENFNDNHLVTNNGTFYFWLAEAKEHEEADTYGDVQVYLEQFD